MAVACPQCGRLLNRNNKLGFCYRCSGRVATRAVLLRHRELLLEACRDTLRAIETCGPDVLFDTLWIKPQAKLGPCETVVERLLYAIEASKLK